ncbi:MAG: helix-turn-helix domain-containing protein, partial [Burkholderiaceae bacterium]|nr:helix-turn-helix domain-containing protein [Burkholderiaceae bacterium]
MTPASAALTSDAGLNTLVAEPNGTVSLCGMPLLLAPKEQAVLHLLLRSWPQAVSKDDFADQIWHGQNMSDASLARCVAKLRQHIPARAGIAIHAVYGWGYRLAEAPCAQISANASESVSHPRLMLAAMAAPRHVEALIQANQWIQQRTAS